MQESARAEECEGVGIGCSEDKTKIQMCLKVKEQPITVRDCSEEGLICGNVEDSVTCMKSTGGDASKFNCLGPGEYPDPEDCKTTYKCSEKGYAESRCVCKENYFVLPVVGLPCIYGDDCPRKAVKCDEVGQTGPFLTRDRQELKYHYYCLSHNKFTSYKTDGNSNTLFPQEVKICEGVK